MKLNACTDDIKTWMMENQLKLNRWHTAPEIRSSQWNDQPHQRTQCMHRWHKNMDDGKSAQTERRQNRSSSLSLFVFLKPSTISLPDSITLGSHNIPFSGSAWNLGFILDSKLSRKKHVIKSAKLLTSSLNTLVQSTGFSLKMLQDSCYFLYPLTAWLL